MNKTNIKHFFSILLIFCIFISYSSFVFASDDSLYVWSSNANTLNILDDNIRPSNTNSNSINTTTNTTSNNTTDVNSNTVPSFNNVSDDESSLLTNATSEVTDDNSLNLESASGILIEQSSGRVLYAHNIHEQLRPASVTKVMSILLIMEALDSRKN